MRRVDLSGQVAVVTGAGRGIGRAHALLLAERGARVVVNDIGASVDGSGAHPEVASGVAAEVESVGAEAIASNADVGTTEGGAQLIGEAIAAFGRVDLLVHNAGIVAAGSFAEQPLLDVRRVIDVHLMGAWNVGQPAWRSMAAQGYGRIVLTTSGAIFGHPMVGAYSAAKHGVIGLTKSMHQEAKLADLDIKVNAVAPIGATRMARDAQKERFGDLMDPKAVAAVVVYLLSRENAWSGEVFHAGASHVCRIFVGQTLGWASGNPGVTPEEVAEHLGEACDTGGFEIPTNTNASTDLIYERVTGRHEKLAAHQVVPEEVARPLNA